MSACWSAAAWRGHPQLGIHYNQTKRVKVGGYVLALKKVQLIPWTMVLYGNGGIIQRAGMVV